MRKMPTRTLLWIPLEGTGKAGLGLVHLNVSIRFWYIGAVQIPVVWYLALECESPIEEVVGDVGFVLTDLHLTYMLRPQIV